jgi:hypothetical protein
MKIIFDYNQEKDIWCLLKKGKGSNNSSTPTKMYEKLIIDYGENPTEDKVAIFIEKYLSDNNINKQEYILNYQKDWDIISKEYQKIAETVFGVSLLKDIVVYLTVNDRCPYNIKDNYFFVSFPSRSEIIIAMHELWHFYTWYKFGIIWEEKIGKQKYNDLKESLTVLLNIECKNLFSKEIKDNGYPQHKNLRNKILEIWEKEKNIEKVWDELIKT